MFQATNKLLSRLLKNAITSVTSGDFAGVLVGAKVGLFTGSPTIGQDTVLADLTEPTYPGYAKQAITAWQGPFRTEENDYELVGGMKLFQMDDATTPTVVTGAFLCDSAGSPDLLGVVLFDEARSLITEDDAVNLEVELALAAAGFSEGPDVD